MQIFQEFTFDAAHRFTAAPPGHKHERLHGHSFAARVVIEGDPDRETGFVVDIDVLAHACADVRMVLDHSYLNDIEGLGVPSLENIAIWIWRRLEPAFDGLARVEVRRDSNRHGCVYDGP